MPENWTYSHTQLEMWRSCQRLYHDAYVLGKRKPTTPNMAFGTLIHSAIEFSLGLDHSHPPPLDIHWEGWWAEYLASFGGTDDFDDPIFNLKTAKKCLDLYKKSPIEGEVQGVEQKFYYEFPDGLRYVSIPDFIVHQGPHCDQPIIKTVDLKFTAAFKVQPLLPYDDQCLGQAIATCADGFIRATFRCDRKSGKVEGPAYEECEVDPVLRDEWIEETWATCREIESWRQKTNATWVKSDKNCFRYPEPCHRLATCKGGFIKA